MRGGGCECDVDDVGTREWGPMVRLSGTVTLGTTGVAMVTAPGGNIPGWGGMWGGGGIGGNPRAPSQMRRGCWAKRTPWYVSPLISMLTTILLSISPP